MVDTKPIYKDSSRPIEERVEDLLSRMTIREKVMQMRLIRGLDTAPDARERCRDGWGASHQPADNASISGLNAIQKYLLEEILSTYSSQGVDLNTKHVEIVIKQMLRNVKIEDSGSTNLLMGEIVDHYKYEEENERAIAEGGVPATAKRMVQGITKAALSNPSFLAAAAFQETSRVLTDAAIKGKVDNLIGLKENLMIGKQMPAGTGFHIVRDVEPIREEELNKSYDSMDENTSKLFDEIDEF